MLVFCGELSPLPFVVGFMNNAATDVEIMPAVVSSIFSLIPSPPAPSFFWGKKETLVMLDERHVRDSWPNKRDLGWEVPRKKGEEELKDEEGRRRSDRWKKNVISRLRYGRWRGVKQSDRREASETGNWGGMSDGARQKEVKEERWRRRGGLWEKQQKNRSGNEESLSAL